MRTLFQKTLCSICRLALSVIAYLEYHLIQSTTIEIGR